MTGQFDCDVAIIGYGPSGVTAANILGSYGIKAIAFERYKDIYRRARAVTVNDWTLRHYQSVGLADALTRDMDETYALRTMTLDGQLLSHVRFPGQGVLGYATSYSIYQPAMEQTLRDGADRFPDVIEVRFDAEVVDIAQDAEGVTVTSRDESGATATARARYALACDGGSSATRERLGIELLGDTIETKWVIIDAFVKRWWPDRHILTFWSDKKRPAVDIALSLGTHRWELPLQPHETEADFATHDQLWALLNAMGVSREDAELHQHAFYKHHVRHAERWREGRVFLLGDAAHLMPPWAGQGMQSGIRDAFNLCWKLKAVLDGALPDDVLDTYQEERALNVERVTQMSVFSGRMVKQELSPEELAAVMPDPGKEPPPSPLLEPPTIEAGWLTGATGPDSAVGRMTPQPNVAVTSGRLMKLDAAIGNGFVLLGDGIDPATLLTDAQRADWDRLGAGYRAVRSPDQASEHADDIIDIESTLLDWMRRYNARVIALRPDRFVAAADPSGLDVPR